MKEKITEMVDKVVSNADIVLYVLDARFIDETRNLKIEQNIKDLGKKVIYILNKADLTNSIDPNKIGRVSPNFIVSCETGEGINNLRKRIRILAKQMKKERVYVGVAGYPNTGKSSLINRMLGRKEIAKTSSESGYTKGIQNLKLSDGVYLIDTPGVIPEAERSNNQIKLAQIGVKMHDNAKYPDKVVYELMQKYPGVFEEFYGIDAGGDTEKLLNEIGRRRRIIMSRGRIDTERVARLILKDWQFGRIRV
jgi:ribosome biogenesis GTPase A